MPNYFIIATSFAAPFFSDRSDGYVEASDVTAALLKFKENYRHPCGLYAAVAYASADAYHKDEDPLGKWLCNHEIAKIQAEPEGGYVFKGNGPGSFEIDGVIHHVDDPRGGQVFLAEESVR